MEVVEEEEGRGSREDLHRNRRLHEQACLPTFIGFYRATHSPIFFYYDKARAYPRPRALFGIKRGKGYRRKELTCLHARHDNGSTERSCGIFEPETVPIFLLSCLEIYNSHAFGIEIFLLYSWGKMKYSFRLY